jgi:hypothetical protein
MPDFINKVTTFLNSMKPVVHQGWQDTKSGFKRMRHFRKPKVYLLKGYTTTTRVDKKVLTEQNQRMLRNILVGAVCVLILAVLLIIYNPFKDLREIFRILGI